MSTLTVAATDYHTAGEPFRIVTSPLPLKGRGILDKRSYAMEYLDEIRRLVINEPRGHADMYGCFVTEPEDEGGDLGVVFFHNEGYSTACGHGTIALVTWALESGVLPRKEPETQVVVDVPSGRLETVARVEGDDVRWVRFRNVPSFVHSTGLQIETSAGNVTADVSFGGAFYASVDAATIGLSVEPKNLTRLIEVGREVKAAVMRDHDVVHPDEPRLRDIYGTIFFERLEDAGERLCQRNVTIFADGEVDRSPCGSGTSARLALLDASGELRRGRELLHLGIVGGEFVAWVDGATEVGGTEAVYTQVQGSAHLSGYHHFVLEPEDPLGTGFLLR
ncbi:MAG TPA: proline racemase family protein [Actinomycetota bacterium]|nr:proline racemase family protein [Actinomycetota bacterium]